MLGLADGIKYLHEEQKIIHGDLSSVCAVSQIDQLLNS